MSSNIMFHAIKVLPLKLYSRNILYNETPIIMDNVHKDNNKKELIGQEPFGLSISA